MGDWVLGEVKEVSRSNFLVLVRWGDKASRRKSAGVDVVVPVCGRKLCVGVNRKWEYTILEK